MSTVPPQVPDRKPMVDQKWVQVAKLDPLLCAWQLRLSIGRLENGLVFSGE